METQTRAKLYPQSYKFTPRAQRLLAALAHRSGLNRTAYLEMTITTQARDAGLNVDAPEEGASDE